MKNGMFMIGMLMYCSVARNTASEMKRYAMLTMNHKSR